MTALTQAASVSAVLSLAAAACSGSAGDKAGGDPTEESVLLTLANVDPDRTNIDSAAFVAAAERLSGRSIRIDVKFDWRSSEPIETAESGAVEDVRAGKVDLAVVPARVWDRLGVTSFRALLAPYLVDSLALEERVIRSSVARRMLATIDRRGIVGVAIIPGELRYPLGVSGPLVAPADYVGATIGVRSTPVARATFRALGASSRAYTPGSISQLDGAELGLVTIASNRYEQQARALTGNVVLWPRAVTIVMNAKTYRELTTRQRDALRRAGTEAAADVVAQIRHDSDTWLDSVCRRGAFSVVRASAAQRDALRRAVAPLYEKIERDPLTRELIAEIRRLRGGRGSVATDTVACAARAAPVNGAARPLQGRWRATLTREELRRSGASPGSADRLAGSWTLEFENGRFEARRAEGGGGTGTYTVDGHMIRFVWDRGIGIRRGEVFVSKWSVYRRRLSFSAVPGSTKLAGLDVEPFTRVR